MIRLLLILTAVLLGGCVSGGSTRYIILSHIFINEMDTCEINHRICKLEPNPEHCYRVYERCVVSTLHKWEKVKKANGYDRPAGY